MNIQTGDKKCFDFVIYSQPNLVSKQIVKKGSENVILRIFLINRFVIFQLIHRKQNKTLPKG